MSIVLFLFFYLALAVGSYSEFRVGLIGFPVSGFMVSSFVLSIMASFFFYFFSFARVSYRFSRSIILSICLFNFYNLSM